MTDWLEVVQQIEAIEDLPLDAGLVGLMQAHAAELRRREINFYTPTFKSYRSSEIAGCGKSAWPAVSITGNECKLACDHCKAKILEPMLPARTPDELWRVVNEIVTGGAGGMLLTGGSNHRDEVEYGPYYPTIRRIKDAFPAFKIALHTALVDRDGAFQMEAAGVDVAMMDVIGAQDTITQVYHLKRPVADFERTLEHLCETSMKVVPHIVIGLHYGRLLGEWNALEIVRRHMPDALVLVVVMPMYAPAHRPFVTPDTGEVGRFFFDARATLPDMPLLLGCARPPGIAKVMIDAYAVLAGIDGIAHPSDGMVELAARLDQRVRVTPACCSIAVGDEVMAAGDTGTPLTLDLAQVIEHERARRARTGNFGTIKVIGGAGCGARP